MSDAKSAAECLLSTRAYCTGQHDPIMNPMRYKFAADDVFAVAKRCLEWEAENEKLLVEVAKLKAGWRTLSCSSLVGLERETQERKGGE